MSGLLIDQDELAIRPRRKWYQFTVGGLLLLMLICAFALGVYRLMNPPPPPPSLTTIALEIDLLHQHIQRVSSYPGICPPSDFTNTGDLQAYVLRAFPRANPASVSNLPHLSPAEALVFWLGGYWDGKKLRGFCSDPQNPFRHPQQPGGRWRTAQLFALDATRLFDRDGNGFPEYYPPDCDPQVAAPYVYFAPDRNGTYSGSYRHPGLLGTASPYRSDDGRFINSDSFQLIWAGLDGDLGGSGDKYFPSGKGFGNGDWDNQTNFSGRSLEDAKIEAIDTSRN